MGSGWAPSWPKTTPGVLTKAQGDEKSQPQPRPWVAQTRARSAYSLNSGPATSKPWSPCEQAARNVTCKPPKTAEPLRPHGTQPLSCSATDSAQPVPRGRPHAAAGHQPQQSLRADSLPPALPWARQGCSLQVRTVKGPDRQAQDGGGGGLQKAGWETTGAKTLGTSVADVSVAESSGDVPVVRDEVLRGAGPSQQSKSAS